jgi:hypothetical protein
MQKLAQKLDTYIVEKPLTAEESLSVGARRIFRALQTETERARQMRKVEGLEFRVHCRGGTPVLLAIMEGRDAMSVSRQVSRRFEEMKGVESSVVGTEKGARIVLKPLEV